MSFLYPSILWALAAISVPVIIHLFNFKKYKIVYFTNVRFLKDLQQKSKAKSRLKEILVLIMRCLTIACLVLAFAQPFIPNNLSKNIKESTKLYSIYIDNSFSTQNINKQGRVIDLEKQKAKELVKSLANADKVQIITNDFEGRHQRLNTKQNALALIDEIKISPAVMPMSKVLKRQTEFLRQSGASSKNIFLFTDLQKSTFDLENHKPDSSVNTYVLPVLPNLVNNVYIDSCWFENPIQQLGFTQKLHARIVNAGNQSFDVISAKLRINQQQVAISSFSIEANSKSEVKFTFNCKQAGFNFCELSIEDYPINFDDKLNFTFNSTNNISVYLITGKNKQSKISTLFKNDSLFKFLESNETAIDYAAFKTADVLILNQLNEYASGLLAELDLFTKKGGSVLIIPNMEANLLSYNQAFNLLNLPVVSGIDTLQLKANEIDQQKGFYEGVFEKKEERMNLPLIKKHYQFKLNSGFENILSLQNGDFLLGFNNHNKAKIYLLSTALEPEAGNFYNHALLVPTLYKICFNSLKQNQLHYSIRSKEVLEIKSNPDYLQTPPVIFNTQLKTEFIPESRNNQNNLIFYFEHQPQEPGYYILKHQQNNILPLAFNYSRIESDLSNYSKADIQSMIDKKNWTHVKLIDYEESKVGELATLVDGGKKLWKLFLLLAITFMLIEISLLRFLNN